MAKLADMSPGQTPVHTQTGTVAILAFIPNKNCQVLSLSTVYQTDKTGDTEAPVAQRRKEFHKSTRTAG